ncbi:uncharacterized protein [Panulirus ornatus]|uniref:uncharacterized protein isoform X4 n=1 Tax=Panulirus ornatus TaxID=150431 RepID=UPI003A886229
MVVRPSHPCRRSPTFNQHRKGPVTASTSSWMWRLCTSYTPAEGGGGGGGIGVAPFRFKALQCTSLSLPHTHTHTPIIRAKEPAHPLLAERSSSVAEEKRS